MTSWQILNGDAIEVLRGLEADSIHSMVTDPPAGISFMSKGWDSDKGGRDVWIVWLAGIMREALRVLKPGAHALVWAIPRTSHWTATAVEDAGFEIRDIVSHLFGSGFPKSLDVSKAIDKTRDDMDEVRVVCRFLRNAIDTSERHTVKTIAKYFGFHPRMVEHWAARDTDSQPALPTTDQWGQLWALLGFDKGIDDLVSRLNTRKGEAGDAWKDARVVGEHEGATPGLGGERFSKRDATIREATEVAAEWQGWGTALKPATEHWILARKPLDATVAACVLEHGTGGINVDGCRVKYSDSEPYDIESTCRPNTRGAVRPKAVDGTPEKAAVNVSPIGRWPPNLLLTHSARCEGAECVACCPVFQIGEQGGGGVSSLRRPTGKDERGVPGMVVRRNDTEERGHADTGTAARFFPTFRYEPKPSTAERETGVEHMKKRTAGELTDRKEGSAGLTPRAGAGRTSKGRANTHPTVKSAALMQWLCRLITPPGGTVLDCFCGSGSTGIAALREGFGFIGIEMDSDYAEIARNRIVGDAPLLNAIVGNEAN